MIMNFFKLHSSSDQQFTDKTPDFCVAEFYLGISSHIKPRGSLQKDHYFRNSEKKGKSRNASLGYFHRRDPFETRSGIYHKNQNLPWSSWSSIPKTLKLKMQKMNFSRYSEQVSVDYGQ